MPTTPGQVIRDYAAATPNFQAVVLRYFNVYGSDPQGRLGGCAPHVVYALGGTQPVAWLLCGHGRLGVFGANVWWWRILPLSSP